MRPVNPDRARYAIGTDAETVAAGRCQMADFEGEVSCGKAASFLVRAREGVFRACAYHQDDDGLYTRWVPSAKEPGA